MTLNTNKQLSLAVQGVSNRAERIELAKVVRVNFRAARSGIEALKAYRLAEMEKKLGSTYKYDEAQWAEVTAKAVEVCKEADRVVAMKCREMGIPDSFRPSIGASWHERGETAVAARRAELRRMGTTKIEAAAQNAKLKLDQKEAEMLTQLATGGLESAEAKAFLKQIPSLEELVPEVAIPAMKVAELAAPFTPEAEVAGDADRDENYWRR